MGYPLKDIPTTSLFISIFQLFLTQVKLNKSQTEQFYYKDVLQFFKHAAILPLLIVDGNNILDTINVDYVILQSVHRNILNKLNLSLIHI